MPSLTIKTHLLIVLVLVLFTPPKEVLAQNEERPDFSGIWSNASRTSLSRPRNTELIVSAEQAQAIVENLSIAGISRENIESGPSIDPDTGAPPAGAADFGLRAVSYTHLTLPTKA